MLIRKTYSWSLKRTRDESADLGSSISGSLGDQALTHRKRGFALVSRTPGVPAVSFLLPSALSAQSTVPKIVTGKHTPFFIPNQTSALESTPSEAQDQIITWLQGSSLAFHSHLSPGFHTLSTLSRSLVTLFWFFRHAIWFSGHVNTRSSTLIHLNTRCFLPPRGYHADTTSFRDPRVFERPQDRRRRLF